MGMAGRQPTRYIIQDNALVVTVAEQSADFVGVLRYGSRVLAESGAPGAASGHFGLTLIGRDGDLPLIELAAQGGVAGYQTMSAPIGTTGLSVEMTTVRTPFTAVELVSFFLPMVMWAAAALIAWLVVDRILIRPLRQLERSVSRYQPGERVAPPRLANSAALEIRQLAGTFGGFVETISTHDAELAAGLARQTRLTREVHHRVKNNLQVVASLINLHARGQTATDVVHAYASIQRRVDALAVVHRNHYAELEENRGVSLRSLVGELAQNIRGSVPEGEPPPPISLDICGCYATQDVAVPVAFLLTELIELSILTDPRAAISVQLVSIEADRARLSVTSAALAETPGLAARMENRFSRVLEGLSRQLRSPLDRDRPIGRFSLDIAIVGDDDGMK
jgi:two-component sensor histidine kinase